MHSYNATGQRNITGLSPLKTSLFLVYNIFMKQYYIDKGSDSLLLFFAGWGCDEYEFEHLASESDVLILYDYMDIKLNFDFSKYKEINMIAFSAGVFIGTLFDFNFKINKKIAIDGNPYLFDEHFGLSKNMQDILFNITEDTAEDFARNYLVKTEEEYSNFHPAKRSLASCQEEFISLKNIYHSKKQDIKDTYDAAIAGDEDPIVDISAQKEYYGDRLHLIKNARHNIFFRIKSFEDIFGYIK